jgi:hypothetical protein
VRRLGRRAILATILGSALIGGVLGWQVGPGNAGAQPAAHHVTADGPGGWPPPPELPTIVP